MALAHLSMFAQVDAPAISKKNKQSLKNNFDTKSLLWKIEGKKIKQASYLFGTIHMIPQKDFFWPPNTQESLDQCERLTLEIDMANLEDNVAAQMTMMMNIFMKNGVTLPKLLTEEEYKMVQDHFANGNLPLPQVMLDKIKPMFLSMMVSEEFDFFGGGLLGGGEEGDDDNTEEKTDDEGIASYEMEFMKIAKEKELKTAGLETAEYQMSIFDSIPYKAQAKMLVDAIVAEQDTLQDMSNQMDDMINKYKTQDLQALYTMLSSEAAGLQDYEDVLLIQRNRNWIPIMKAQMKEMPTFFAVGAGHLAGPEGVLELLKAQGYKLTPLSSIE